MSRLHYRKWRHIFKLDPDKPISPQTVEKICLSGTDAVMVGGSSGVTYAKTARLLELLEPYKVPRLLEVSVLAALVPGFDGYLIPVVLNTQDAKFIVGFHQQAAKQYAGWLPWERVVSEGYVIMNPAATAARVTGAITDLQPADIAAYAAVAEHVLHLPVFYLEYSGAFGDLAMLEAARGELAEARLFYGGGIDSADKARQASEWADTIIVGNVIYQSLEQALATVAAVGTAK